MSTGKINSYQYLRLVLRRIMPILHQEPELTAKRTAQLTQRLMLRQSTKLPNPVGMQCFWVVYTVPVFYNKFTWTKIKKLGNCSQRLVYRTHGWTCWPGLRTRNSSWLNSFSRRRPNAMEAVKKSSGTSSGRSRHFQSGFGTKADFLVGRSRLSHSAPAESFRKAKRKALFSYWALEQFNSKRWTMITIFFIHN